VRERVLGALIKQRRRAMVETRPIDRHQIDRIQTNQHQLDRSSQRMLTRPEPTDRHLEVEASVLGLASNRRWELSYGGEHSDSHRWLRFR